MREGRAGMREGRAGVWEGRAGMREGRTGVREGRAGMREGRAGVWEGRAGMREGRAGVLKGRAGVLKGKAGVLKGKAGVLKGKAGVLKGRGECKMEEVIHLYTYVYHMSFMLHGCALINSYTIPVSFLTTPMPLWRVPGKPRHLLVSLQENTTDIDENVRDRVSDEIKRFRENYKVWWCAGSAHVHIWTCRQPCCEYSTLRTSICRVNTAPYALLYAV